METSDRRYQELMALQPPRTASRIMPKQIPQHPDFGTPLIGVAREVTEILLVDPDPDGLGAVQAALRRVADVKTCSTFRAARARLLSQPPDLLVTNLRLEAYNGLHLLHLAAGTRTRCIAYATYDDLVLAREVQALGAFYERARRLPLTLPSYLTAMLPRHDRRNPTVLDRRLTFRGGRRCADL